MEFFLTMYASNCYLIYENRFFFLSVNGLTVPVMGRSMEWMNY